MQHSISIWNSFVFPLQLLHDIVNLSFQLIYMACSLFWPVLHCYYASSITQRIEDTAVTAYSSKWFDLHIKLQKFVILMMIRSQEELHFTGWSIIYCTMETLGKVFRMNQMWITISNNFQCSSISFSCSIHPFLIIWFIAIFQMFEYNLVSPMNEKCHSQRPTKILILSML